jgi:hypothetical protein
MCQSKKKRRKVYCNTFSNLCLPALPLLTEWPKCEATNVGWGREDDGSASGVDADGASRVDDDGGASRIDNDGGGMYNADVGIKDDDGRGIDATCGTKDGDTGPKDGKVGTIEGPGVKDDLIDGHVKEEVDRENNCGNVKVSIDD